VKGDQIFGLVIKILTGFDLIQINIFTPIKYLEILKFCVSCSMKKGIVAINAYNYFVFCRRESNNNKTEEVRTPAIKYNIHNNVCYVDLEFCT